MKKIYLKELRRYFEQRLAQTTQGFEPTKLDRSHLLHGSLCYAKRLGEADIVYVCVRPSPKGEDEFDIELGWSREGRIPETFKRSAELYAFTVPAPEQRLWLNPWPESGMWEFEQPRLPGFTPLPHQLTGEPLTAEIARSVVESVTENAVQMLISVGLPILEQFEAYVKGEQASAAGSPRHGESPDQ